MLKQPEPYYTLWEIIEKWSIETKTSPMDVLKILRRASTYPEIPTSEHQETPLLVIWPIALISAHGALSTTAAFDASRLDNVVNEDGTATFRSRLRTREYRAALEFLNSAKCPPQPTEEVKNSLSEFGVLRKDFQTWCLQEHMPLPAFWFSFEKGSASRTTENVARCENEVAKESAGGVKAHEEPPSLESCVELLRAKKIPDELAAYLIRENTTWANHDIARAYGLDKGLNEDQHDARKQKGQRFCNRGKTLAKEKSLRDRIDEIVTLIRKA